MASIAYHRVIGRLHLPMAYKQCGRQGGSARLQSTVVQGLWACVLGASGTFDQLTNCIVFASWIFYALSAFSLFHFRRKLSAPVYRTPAFPWTPVIFIACALLLIVNTLWTMPKESLAGLGLIAAGIPVYFLLRNYRLRPEKIDN